MLHTTKLLACFLLCLSCFSCDSEKRTSSKNISNEQIEEQRKSALQQQILLMLQGKPHDETVLRSEIKALGKDRMRREYRTSIDLHTQTYGQKPKKKFIMRTYSILSLINSEIEHNHAKDRLKKAKNDNKKSLEELEKAIQEAIEKEKSKRR